jgi:putative flippase GtrA
VPFYFFIGGSGMKLKQQIPRFLLIGITSSLIDLAIYSFASYQLDFSPELAKAFGFLGGASFGFALNRKWTFGSKDLVFRRAGFFLLLYLLSLALNISINSLVLYFGQGYSLTFMIAFVCATGASAATNFIGLRYWVFKRTMSRLTPG